MLNNFIKKITGCKSSKADGSSNVICGCINVTEQDLIDAVNKGANSFKEVQDITKVGTGCGKCVGSNEALVNELILNKKIDENPVVCGCMDVKLQDMINAIKNGAKSFEEVQTATNVGTGCGMCVESNRALVSELLTRNK